MDSVVFGSVYVDSGNIESMAVPVGNQLARSLTRLLKASWAVKEGTLTDGAVSLPYSLTNWSPRGDNHATLRITKRRGSGVWSRQLSIGPARMAHWIKATVLPVVIQQVENDRIQAERQAQALEREKVAKRAARQRLKIATEGCDAIVRMPEGSYNAQNVRLIRAKGVRDGAKLEVSTYGGDEQWVTFSMRVEPEMAQKILLAIAGVEAAPVVPVIEPPRIDLVAPSDFTGSRFDWTDED